MLERVFGVCVLGVLGFRVSAWVVFAPWALPLRMCVPMCVDMCVPMCVDMCVPMCVNKLPVLFRVLGFRV